MAILEKPAASFLSFAQISVVRIKTFFFSARQSMSADPAFSGTRVRVNSAVQNFEEFGKGVSMRQKASPCTPRNPAGFGNRLECAPL